MPLKKFSGTVPASQALIHSLNVPAVRLLNAFGVNQFYNLLKESGVSTLFRPADDYGLPLILGGAEVTPWDMGKHFAGLANGGNFNNIYSSHDKNRNSGIQLVSRGASRLVLEEMKELIRPGLEFYWKKYGSQRPLAWKTGTSYGHKDAWAVGTSPKWTVVVWVGNFSGESNKNLSGMKSAGPLLFNIYNVLPKTDNNNWFELDDEDYVDVIICEETGFYAGKSCPSQLVVQAPKEMKPIKLCSYHQTIFIDSSEKHVVCSYCWSGSRIERQILKYPPDVSYYLRQNGAILGTVPEHNPKCSKRQERDVLSIIYPLNGAKIFIPREFGGRHEPLISRIASQYVDRETFWYLNDTFLGTSVGKPSFAIDIKQGEHKLTVEDSEGNKSSSTFSVILN